MALLCGADLVLEIPSIFAVSSAEDFAAGAVALLDQLGVVTIFVLAVKWEKVNVLWKQRLFLQMSRTHFPQN